MKNKFLKIFYLIIIFIMFFGCSQVHATLKTYTDRPSYWGDSNKNSMNKSIMNILNAPAETTKNAFVNEPFDNAPSTWKNFAFTGYTSECMVFLNEYIKKSSISDLTKEIDNASTEMDAILSCMEKYLDKSSSNIHNSFVRALEDVPKNELDKYNTDGIDGFTRDESSAFYTAYIVKNAEEFCKDIRYSIQKIHIAEGKTYTVNGKTVNYNDDINTKKKYTKEQMQEYIKQYGELGLESIKKDATCAANWRYNLGKSVDDYNNEEIKKYINDTTGKEIVELQSAAQKAQEKVETKNEEGYKAWEQGDMYHLPEREPRNKNNTNLDEIINGADKFIKSATKDEIDSEAMQNLSNTIYNILLVVGIIIAIIIGAVIGIMFITGSVEQKADVKKLLIPYIVGCVVVFGSFAIWKIVVIMFSTM